MQTILSIDLGTTYFKAALFDDQMRLLALARHPTPVLPAPAGCREIDPGDFKNVLLDLAAGLRRECPQEYGSVAAVTFSTQTNSFLLLDGNDRPLTPILLWSDERASGDPLPPQGNLPGFQQRTGMADVSHYMMTAKLAWLRRHRPEVCAATRRLCLVSDFLTYWLTGRHVSTAGAAGFTGLLDIHQLRWWPEACTAADVPLAWLPSVFRAGTDLGHLRPETADAWHLPRSCRLVAGCLDQYAGAIGAGNRSPGGISETTGTVLTAVRCADGFSAQSEMIHQGPSFQPGWYWQMALDNQGANLLESFRNLQPDAPDFATLDAEAERTPPGAEGLRLVRSFSSDPRDAFSGLTPRHTRGHMARCIMETIAWKLASQLDRLCGSDRPSCLRCCGGASRSPTWLQIKADVLNIPCASSNSPEPACLGAALLAARGLGWKEQHECLLDTLQWIHPRPEVHDYYLAHFPERPF